LTIAKQANPEELEQALGYVFGDRSLLARSLTHSSSANEAPAASGPLAASTGAEPVRTDNERLEFLGDSVLGWVVSDCIFRRFPDFNEGQLSLLKNHLVSATHLLAVAHQLELGKYLQLGRGEETAGGRSKQRLLVNAFEAVLAAVYLDGGAEAARELVTRCAIPGDEELAAMAGAGPPHDFRAELERIARDRRLPRPLYHLVSEDGPGHARVFRVEVRVGRDISAAADGSSKKTASHNAARLVCGMLCGGGPKDPEAISPESSTLSTSARQS
jgi:ribonuclease-3